MHITNLHTHSLYCDGAATIEEMIVSAIENGFDSLGISSH
jgi:histidinol-phosphatase (PHP family)